MDHPGPQDRQTHRVSSWLQEEAKGSMGLDYPGPLYRQTHRVSTHRCAGVWEEAEISGGWTIHPGPQDRQTHRVSAWLQDEAKGSRGLDYPGPKYRQTHRVSTHRCAGLWEEAEISRVGTIHPGPQHRQTHIVSACLQE